MGFERCFFVFGFCSQIFCWGAGVVGTLVLDRGGAQVRLFLVTLFLFIAPGLSTAGEIVGRVIGVTDGDTLTVLDAAQVSYKVRLGGIDAPEKGQPFGQRSKEGLSRLVFNRQVTILFDKKDRYGRFVGKVMLGGGDVNLSLVSSGFAWHYKEYEKEQSLTDRVRYSREERDARDARRGLWVDVNPVAPWDFRKSRRE